MSRVKKKTKKPMGNHWGKKELTHVDILPQTNMLKITWVLIKDT